MDRNEFLSRLEKIRVWRQGDARAPHKPLLILLALGRLARGKARLAGYGTEIEEPLEKLLRRFGPPRRSHHPDQPFRRLPGDRLWEIPGFEALPVTGSGGPRLAALRGAAGGFPPSVQALLEREADLVREAAQRLLDKNFPQSMHEEIRAEVGLLDYGSPLADPWTELASGTGAPIREMPRAAAPHRPVRDPAFRYNVLRAYERRCAVCDYDLRVEDRLLGLEAAHIKWHAAGGPDAVPNGLALCSFHNKALDAGALGLERKESGVIVLIVSSEVNGRSLVVQHLRGIHEAPLRAPQSRRYRPDPQFIDWHRREVFRGPDLNG